MIVREQRQLTDVVLVRLKSLDRTHPTGVLPVVQLAQIQHLWRCTTRPSLMRLFSTTLQ